MVERFVGCSPYKAYEEGVTKENLKNQQLCYHLSSVINLGFQCDLKILIHLYLCKLSMTSSLKWECASPSVSTDTFIKFNNDWKNLSIDSSECSESQYSSQALLSYFEFCGKECVG